MLKITGCKIKKTQAARRDLLPGIVFEENGQFFIVCGVGDLEIFHLQLEGGKEMSIRDFLTGHRDFIGSKLG